MLLTTFQLGLACRIFLHLAYPEGSETIPVKKRVYLDLPQDQPVEDFLAPNVGQEICQAIQQGNEVRGYALRLGSKHFPHLKLKVQQMDHNSSTTWIFTVDTHDAFSKASFTPPEDHPDAQAWLTLQRTNRELKEQIEKAWQEVGITTFNSLLRSDLANTAR